MMLGTKPFRQTDPLIRLIWCPFNIGFAALWFPGGRQNQGNKNNVRVEA